MRERDQKALDAERAFGLATKKDRGEEA